MKLLKILFFLFLTSSIRSEKPDQQVYYLEAGETIHYVPSKRRAGIFETDISIYCYRGNEKALPKIFQTVLLQLDIETEEFTQYEGPTPEIVKSHYEKQRSIFSLNILSSKKTRLKLNPFNQTCIGIETLEPYRIKLHVVRLDFWKITLLSLGLLTFFFSPKLSENALFYYITGILLGIFASILLLIYLLGKLIPQRPVMYGVLLGGWAIAIYLLQILWENIQVILVTYHTFVLWYIVFTGFISFVICYRFGPPKNQRSKNLVKWGLQILATVMIFFSSQYEEASVAMIISTFMTYYFPRKWVKKARGYYLRRFPPKPRLLTNEEYYEQGVRETTKALEGLRQYCSSPECKQWKMITKLKDPVRFASFVEGSSHIEDEEILEYETSRADASGSDLSEEEENRDNENISEDEDYEYRNNYNIANEYNNYNRESLVEKRLMMENAINTSPRYSRPPTNFRNSNEFSDED